MAHSVNTADLRKASTLERAFMLRWDGPEYVREHKFCPQRNWRFDFAWPDSHVAVECEGGIWKKNKDGSRGGRHNHPMRFEDDCEKYNTAQLMGWIVIRLTESMLKEKRWMDAARSIVHLRAA